MRVPIEASNPHNGFPFTSRALNSPNLDRGLASTERRGGGGAKWIWGGVFDIWFGRRLHHLMERARQPTPENILPWTLLVRTRHFDVQVDDGFGCDVVVAMAKLGG
ncbi:hypothetical protein B296_00044472 [Ensete ventricosum]|uniref:Uncharacterized protein n=1 Tax=Ensete ventricosum TaxID=4639 RepID=A0A426XI35_ENSVE|nr:hypothetical protein B296_00044472 [Ensete ventricosum]